MKKSQAAQQTGIPAIDQRLGCLNISVPVPAPPAEVPRLVRSGVGIVCALALLIGGFWLAAWLTGMAGRWSAEGALTMKTNMALALLLAGAALALLWPARIGTARRWAGALAAAAVFLIGGLTLSQHLFGWNLGIDQFLAREAPGALATASPNRIGLPGSASLALLGLGLMALAWGRKKRAAAPVFGLTVCVVVLVPLVGYLYDIEAFYSRGAIGIAWPTVEALLALGSGLVLAHHEGSLIGLLLRGDAGGILLRRMLPITVLIPLALGYLRLLGQHHGLYEMATGTGLLVITLIVLFSVMLWRAAIRLSRVDQAEDQQRRALQASETETRRQKDLLQVTLASIGDAVIVTDLAGRITFLNGEAERLTGWSIAEAAGRPLAEVFRIVNEETRQTVESPVDKVLRLGGVVGLANHTILIARHGVETPIDDSGSPVRATDGTIHGVVLVFRDISERKQQEEKLRQSEARMRAVFGALVEGIVFLNQQGEVVEVNEAVQRLHDHSLVELSDPEHDPRCQIVRGDGTPFDVDEQPARVALRTGQAVRDVEMGVPLRDGSMRWRLVNAQPVYDDRGQLLGAVASFFDITERKRAEEALRQSRQKYAAIHDHASFPIALFKLPEGVITEVNAAFERFFEWPREEAIGKTTVQLGLNADPEARARMFAELAAKGFVRDWEMAVRTRSGRDRLASHNFDRIEIDGQAYFLGTAVDITERKRAEWELEQMRTMLTEGERIAHLGTWRWDAVTGETVWSEEEFRIYGLEPGPRSPSYQELMTKSFHPEDAATLDRVFREAIRTGSVFENDHRIIRPDGTIRFIHNRAHPHFDSHGKLLAYIGATLDITERKRAEEALRESEDRLRLALDAAEFGVFDMKPQTGDLGWDKRTKAIWGIAENDKIDYSEGLQRLHPDDRERVARLVAGSLNPDGNGSYEVEYRIVWPDGSIHWSAARARVYFEGEGANRRPVRMLGVEQDITERKRAEEALRDSEEHFRVLTQNLESAVALIDEYGTFSIVNNSFRRMFDFPEDADILNINSHDWAQWQVLDERGSLLDVDEHPVRKAALTRTAVRNQFVALKAPSSRDLKWLLVSAEPVLDAHGKLHRLICTYYDITARKQAEDALGEANAQLREADRRKDEFLAMLAHELRNPLAPVRNAVQIMKMVGAKDPVMQKNRDMIERQISHMAHLLDDLLDVSRITRGKITLQMERVDLRTVVAQAVEVAEQTSLARPLKIHYQNPAEPVWVNGDYTRLEQIVGNLMNNALKFTDEGRIEVSLGCEWGKAGDCGWAAVHVRDTGLGITPEMLPHVFDLFAQADQSLDRRRGGLGIGLTMVNLLVQMHGGRITAQSDGPGKGSVFSIRLPLAVLPETKTMEEDTERSDAMFTANRGRPQRVLVVDDNEDAAASMVDIMQLWGFETEMAHDGPTAVRRAMENPPDVILLDIGLPGMNGYEVARLLRCEAKLTHIKIIALTGYGQDEARQRSKECGFDGHLVKPVDIAELQALLMRMMVTGSM